MIGNGRRGGGTERDRDMEEDEDEGREERSSEGGGGGGFGGWRSHLLGGLTQRVKSWYWGARPLVSFNIKRTINTQKCLFTHRYFFYLFLFFPSQFFSCLSYLLPFFFFFSFILKINSFSFLSLFYFLLIVSFKSFESV